MSEVRGQMSEDRILMSEIKKSILLSSVLCLLIADDHTY